MGATYNTSRKSITDINSIKCGLCQEKISSLIKLLELC